MTFCDHPLLCEYMIYTGLAALLAGGIAHIIPEPFNRKKAQIVFAVGLGLVTSGYLGLNPIEMEKFIQEIVHGVMGRILAISIGIIVIVKFVISK
jgi:hypothetical protein